MIDLAERSNLPSLPRGIGQLPLTNGKPKTNRTGAATLTARALATSGMVGLWADRIDLPDAPEYARQLRRRAEPRLTI